MKRIIAIFGVLLFLSSSSVFSEQERLEAVLESNFSSPGNPIYLNLAFYGSKDVSRPDVPEVNGLRIKYVGPSTQISVVNGKVSQSITHAYLIIPLKEGEYKIGPFFADYGGRIFSASPVTLTVKEGMNAIGPTSAVTAPSPGQIPTGRDFRLY